MGTPEVVELHVTPVQALEHGSEDRVQFRADGLPRATKVK